MRLATLGLTLALVGLLAPLRVQAQRVRASRPDGDVRVQVRRAPDRRRDRVRAQVGTRGGVEVEAGIEVSAPQPRVVVVEHASLGTAPHHEVREQPPEPPRRATGSGLRVASFHLGYAGAWDHIGEVQGGLKLAIAAHLADDTWFLELAATPVRWGEDASGRTTNAPSGTVGIRVGATLAPQYGRFYGVLATGGGAMTYPDQARSEVGVWVSQLGFGVEFGAPGFGDDDGIGGFVDVRAEAWVFGGGLEPRIGLVWSTGLAIALY